MEKKLTHGSLFSGIGGFDLAAQEVGWENLFHCEWDPFCRQVLDYHFPDTQSYENIKTTDFREWEGKVDVLSGGFPCQPFSMAGQRRGTEDDRYLWPEMLRAITEIRPTWVVGENVAGLLSMVQPSEEVKVAMQTDLFGQEGVIVEEENKYVLYTIIRDLEEVGYDVQPFVIPACAVGAPHRRDRLWIVANAHSYRCNQGRRSGGELEQQESEKGRTELGSNLKRSLLLQSSANAHGKGLEGGYQNGELEHRDPTGCDWSRFPSESPICGGDDGLPEELDGIAFSNWRMNSIKAYGNAIVPEVARVIFEQITKVEELIREEIDK